jgi:GNAT acetyltransferase-like protein
MTPQSTTIYQVDPLRDSRWPRFVDGHPNASVFHTAEWLQALVKTYGYRAVVFTTAAPGTPLTSGIVCCQVNSWLTGRRLVSLPFSDHCEPLLGSAEELRILLTELEKYEAGRWKYVEIRPRSDWTSEKGRYGGFGAGARYFLHTLDLKPGLEELFRSFHKDCVQRKIHKAEKEGLNYEEGRSEALLMKFYQLLLLTRRRHHLPPQPFVWFRNLTDCLGDKLSIRVASKDRRPIASILTLAYKDSLVYKYGCSDEKFHNLGGMIFLLWRSIQDAKRIGAREFDLGRSEPDNPGLIAFKDHLGASQSRLVYFRFPAPQPRGSNGGAWMGLAKRVFEKMPDSLLTTAGRFLYRHIG